MAKTQITIHTSTLFDSKRKRFVENISIDVDPATGLITRTYARDEALPEHDMSSSGQPNIIIIDLRGLTVVPGFVDAHTHIFLHGYSEVPALNQMRDESAVERIVRATNHARAALEAGFTTYRDLGTEGLRDADVHFRNAINRGLIAGPRMFVATECIASSGGYELRLENPPPPPSSALGADVHRISDPADGIYGVRAAVRRRLGAGADIVKFYADYEKRRLRFPGASWPGAREVRFAPSEHIAPDNDADDGGGETGSIPIFPLFTQEEMDAMVAEARAGRCPVAAHAESPEAVVMAARAGVTSVEHGGVPSAAALEAMRAHGTIFVPTLAVYDEEMRNLPGFGENGERYFRGILAHAKAAFDAGVKLACGGDVGAFPHGENAREMEFMVEAGVPVLDVLQAATLHGWEACGADLCGRRFGAVEKGFAADIVALDGDVLRDLKALRRVNFVMKDGQVYKNTRQGKEAQVV